MSPADEQELHRVSAMLAAIDDTLPASSPLREGLVKAGFALCDAFIDGQRGRIDELYNHLNAHRSSLGIDPDGDPSEGHGIAP